MTETPARRRPGGHKQLRGASPPNESHQLSERTSLLRRRELKEENARLHEMLDAREVRSIEVWETLLPEDMRDRIAARALFMCLGAPWRALKMIGIDLHGLKQAEITAIVQRTFVKPAIRALLEVDFAEVRKSQRAIIARTVEISLFEDADKSLKATSLLAKIDGWITGPEVQVNVDRRTVNLYNLVDQGEGRSGHGDDQQRAEDLIGGDPMKILGHEPGEPERIETDSGDIRIDRAIASGAPAQRLEDL